MGSQWMTTPPTRAGWYWAYVQAVDEAFGESVDHGVSLVYVRQGRDDPDRPFQGQWTCSSWDGLACGISIFAAWLGPLPMHSPPATPPTLHES
jgi:hypothetical protein